MTNQELEKWCNQEISNKPYLVFPEDLFSSLNLDQAEFLVEKFGHSILIYLPEKEIKFFEWLKINDNAIWNDLWGNDTLIQEPYVVSISFLPLIIEKARGFPICDLLENTNYYFTSMHILGDESKIFIESAKQRQLDKQPLTISQLLAVEISFAPIDIWRFSYYYNIELDKAKKAVDNLVDDNVLVHLETAEQLANFVDLSFKE